MIQEFTAENYKEPDGTPSGGEVRADVSSPSGPEGTKEFVLYIRWQHGPLGPPSHQQPANGVFVETVIAAAVQRLEHFQESKFKCRENALAITKLEEALHWLNARTQRRVKANTEGTHEGN